LGTVSGTLKDGKNRVTRDSRVVNKLGIHARPAAAFVKLASRFESEIFVEKDGEKVNGKSVMGLMMLAAGPGSKIKIHAAGPDAAAAVEELAKLVESGFSGVETE